MNLLIIGGTRFVGRALVEAALANGYQVTLFNRGKSNPALFPEIEKIHGDRESEVDLAQLRGRTWDAVIDTCGYVPRTVHKSTEALKDSTDHYTFISTLSVYADANTPDANESAPLAKLDDPDNEEFRMEAYGPLKVLSEQAAEAVMPGRVLVIRPGFIVGPYDATERFIYWPRRVARGGEVLVPQPPDQPLQFIDVRDLAEWNLRMAAQKQIGIFNATSPARQFTMRDVVETSKQVSGSDATFTWISPEFLLEQKVEPFSDLPFWLPAGQNYDGMFLMNVDKAVRAGLTFRPLVETIRGMLDWEPEHLPRLTAANQPLAGMSAEKEQEILAAWKKTR
jgi:2'-hydroxyisoflavone reductase